jgi:hypothetical protein
MQEVAAAPVIEPSSSPSPSEPDSQDSKQHLVESIDNNIDIDPESPPKEEANDDNNNNNNTKGDSVKEKAPEPTTRCCEFCLSDIPFKAVICRFCGAHVHHFLFFFLFDIFFYDF